jgi:hypothetical protein
MRKDQVILLAEILTTMMVVFGLTVLFYLTLHRCLNQIKRSNRDLEPPMVWLNLVPLLNLVWTFVTVSRVGSSLRKEFGYREWKTEGERFGVTMGTAYGTLLVMSHIPCMGLLFVIPMFVTMVIYWMQIAGYSGRLTAEPARKRRRQFEDDEIFEALDMKPMPIPPPVVTTGPADERFRR